MSHCYEGILQTHYAPQDRYIVTIIKGEISWFDYGLMEEQYILSIRDGGCVFYLIVMHATRDYITRMKRENFIIIASSSSLRFYLTSKVEVLCIHFYMVEERLIQILTLRRFVPSSFSFELTWRLSVRFFISRKQKEASDSEDCFYLVPYRLYDSLLSHIVEGTLSREAARVYWLGK